MRDLKIEELAHVYGAGGRGKKWCAPKKKKHGKGGSSGSGGRHAKSSGSGGRGRKGSS